MKKRHWGRNKKSSLAYLTGEKDLKLDSAGYKIYEVPISYNPRSFDEGKKITWKDGVKALWVLLRYRFTK